MADREKQADLIGRRLRNLREKLRGENLDALVVLDIDNLRYLTGFSGSTGALIVTQETAVLLVDGRYTVQAGEECPAHVEVSEFKGGAGKAIVEAAARFSPHRFGFESDAVTYRCYQQIRRLRKKKASLRAVGGIVQELRAVKDAAEIGLIREAARIADECVGQMVEWLRPGLSEREVAAEIDYRLRKLGADKPAFDTIVASGPRAALPHARPTGRKLRAGDFVVMDFGAEVGQYPSDITRTVAIGKADEKQREAYQIVLEAQELAIRAIRPGVSGKDVDSVARDHIASAGYRDNFGHGLGHGLGRGVHDGPAFSPLSKTVLKEGMVVTVEPGIYIPGWGGVRIEDDVLLTAEGCELLTHYPKSLLEISA